MTPRAEHAARDVRRRLIEAGGSAAQDLGVGRVLGQVLVYLYLADGDSAMERIEKDLGLSKASVSIAARQLEQLGLVRRACKPGDRRSHYRTVDDIGTALRAGLVRFVRGKMDALGGELDAAYAQLQGEARGASDPELRFLVGRVQRAKVLRDRASRVLGSPLVKILVGRG
jgi:DNA-binding transcriptional regulator GbsR (MarR family)